MKYTIFYIVGNYNNNKIRALFMKNYYWIYNY